MAPTQALTSWLTLILALPAGGRCVKMICEEFRPCVFPWEEPPTVSNAALAKVSEVLLRRDAQNAARYIRLDYQSRIRSSDLVDEAPKPLMEVSDIVFLIPTVAKVHKMFDNYIVDSAMQENFNREKFDEVNDLVKDIVDTNVMQIAFDFLATNGIVNRNLYDFTNLLIKIWFLHYSRTNKNFGSSAFESIFMAELTHGKISGMHNWIFFSSQEANKTADYMGYKKKVNLGNKGSIVQLRYKWLDVVKPSGFMFVGTSPELEMALYSICFLTRPDRPCHLSLAGQNVTICTRTVVYNDEKYMRSASLRI